MSGDDEFAHGVARVVTPLVRRVVAPNPGRMTGPGTNTYLVGHDDVVVIDPGPEDDGHRQAILAAANGRIRAIVCTHTHIDHWPGAAALREATGAAVLAYDGRDGLQVDGELGDGDLVPVPGIRLRSVHTPGHASNHLCFLLEDEQLLFSGDHVMNGSTVVIRPPDGDMAAYVAQLARLRRLGLRAIAPAHGGLITDPEAKLAEYLEHRAAREDAVLAALRRHGTTTISELVPVVYRDVPAERHDIARFSLWAHLIKLAGGGEAVGHGLLGPWRSVTTR